MQRKPSFPVANCNIKMPDIMGDPPLDEESDQLQKRQQLINFGHSQWGFNNWSWSVSKQELDFVEFSNGKHTAGVVSFVSVTVKSFDIHRENIGYATASAASKGLAIHKARKVAVTNALRETLLSFGGSVSTELLEILTDSHKSEVMVPPPPPQEPQPENNQNNQNAANQAKPVEPKNSPINRGQKKEDGIAANARSPLVTAPVKNVPSVPPVAKAHPMPANLPPAANRPPLAANTPRLAAPARPNSNEIAPPAKPLESMTEEEARAERKRRQRLAQEEFRLKQMMKTGAGMGNAADVNQKPEVQKSNATSSFDSLLLDIPTQDIVIDDTGSAATSKRKSPASDGAAKRRSVINRLDIVTD